MINYAVIIGNPTGCHTVEHHGSAEVALARVAEWRGAGHTAQAYEVRLDLVTLEVVHTPLD